MHKEMEKEHVLTFACIALDWFHSGDSGFCSGGGTGAWPQGDPAGERLSLCAFIVFDFVSSVSEFPVEN